MFESYSHVIGGIFAHAGIGGFLEAEAVVEANTGDLQTEAEKWLVTEWWLAHCDKPVTSGMLENLLKRAVRRLRQAGEIRV